MASELRTKSSLEKHNKPLSGQSVEGNSWRSTKELPKTLDKSAPKKPTVELTKSLSSSAGKPDPKLIPANPRETKSSIDQTTGLEKKAVENFKDSSASAKTSGSAKTSERLEFVESGKSSLCRGSTSTDISDESSCSSLSSAVNKPHKANDLRWEAIQAVRSKDGVLDLRHFRLLKKLGCGDIGSVYLSELCGTKCYFAMKVMDKASLAGRKKLLRAQTEREILQSLDHPFLPSLYTHFETEKFSCLVMEFCPGGDLHTLRQRQPGKHFSEQAVKFYVAEVLLALEYLHMLGIVYRDLKPENVLVREDGHIMLSDFDLSLRCTVSPTLIKSSSTLDPDPARRNPVYCIQPTCIQPPSCVGPTTCFGPRLFSGRSKKDRKPSKNEIGNQVSPLPELIAEPTEARSMSFVGTHEYLAPEIIKGEGHGSAVDWWTFAEILEKTSKDFFLKTNRTLREVVDVCYDKLSEIPALKCLHKPEGAMSTMVKINLSLLEDVEDDMDFALKLASEESVLVLPGSVVGLKNWLRLSFAVELTNLQEGLERIEYFCSRHSKK